MAIDVRALVARVTFSGRGAVSQAAAARIAAAWATPISSLIRHTTAARNG
jgi:hypothetical protein